MLILQTIIHPWEGVTDSTWMGCEDMLMEEDRQK